MLIWGGRGINCKKLTVSSREPFFWEGRLGNGTTKGTWGRKKKVTLKGFVKEGAYIFKVPF